MRLPGRATGRSTGPRDVRGAVARLPDGAGPPFIVFVNGVEQKAGTDYTVRDGEVRFLRSLRVPRERFWHQAVQTLAGVGIYNQGDAVDVHYQDPQGAVHVASQVRFHAPPGG